MTTHRPIERTHAGLRGVATYNGKAAARVFIYAEGDGETPLATGDENLADPNGRAIVLEQLAEGQRADADVLLRQLAASVAAEQTRPEEATAGRPSDDELALAFSDMHGERLRYLAERGQWWAYRGDRWSKDSTLEVFDLARDLCRTAAADLKPAAKVATTSASTVAAVLRHASADRRHALRAEQLDADPMLLNTPAGVVDLRTGTLRKHSAADLMTKCTAVAPEARDCPQWLAFLGWASGDDPEMVDFLQRWFGYCLTGDTREEKMLFVYGPGGNGKGTMVKSIEGIQADYATTAPMEVFAAERGERHPTELALLHGARLVTAQETEEGRGWNESRIKALTGRDRIPARFMRQDFFLFEPTFKLAIFGNHRPTLRNVDEAIRRRLLLVPFRQRVEIPDLELKDRLRAEWPAILHWMIQGCLAWLEGGLRAPAAVLAATDDYLESEDVLGQWLEQTCILTPPEERSGVFCPPWTSSAALFASWSRFAQARGQRPGSSKRLSQEIESRGPVKADGGPRGKTRGFHWIEIDRSGLPDGVGEELSAD